MEKTDFKFTLNFDFTTVNKNGMFTGRRGKIDFDSEMTIEELQNSPNEVELFIKHEMEKSTKQIVFHVDNLKIQPAPVK